MANRLPVLLAVLGFGCSALINPDESRLGDGPDAGVGADAAVGFDAGAGVDAGLPAGDDAGPPVGCEPTPPACDGDDVVTCPDGVEARRDCQAEGGYCEAGGCRPWVCVPGSRACGAGLESVVVCDARGTAETEIPCTGGACDPATNMCEGVDPGACAGLPEIGVGDERTVDLCEEDDDHTFRAGGDCDPRFGANAGDRVFALRITERGRYRIELEDDAILRDIDTVVYVRRQCDEDRSQIACGDDTRCMPTGPFGGDCMDGVRLGLSRVVLDLEPGTYYVVADAFLYDTERGESECGSVELRVREAG